MRSNQAHMPLDTRRYHNADPATVAKHGARRCCICSLYFLSQESNFQLWVRLPGKSRSIC